MDQIIFPAGLVTPDEFAGYTPAMQNALRYGVRGGSGDWCYGSIQVCATRVAKLTANGAPNTGASNGLVTNALIEATISPEIEAGANLTVKNGCGDVCQTFRDCDRLTGLTIELQLCHLDAQLIAFLTGSTTIVDTAGAGQNDIIGMELPSATDTCPNGVSLELWAKAWDGGSQAQPTFLGGNTNAYFHWVFPKVRFQIGQIKLENDFMRIPVSGFAQENDSLTVNGPFDDWPADIAARGGFTNVGGFFLDSSIPTASCEVIAVSSAAS